MIEKEQILIKIKKSIKNVDSNADIILFGSRARGDNSNLSDWDLLVLVDTRPDYFEDKFRDNLYEIELETGQIISTLVYSKDYWLNTLKYSPLYHNVNRDGISL